MAARTRKAGCIYLLLVSTVVRHTYCIIQPGFGNGMTGHSSSTFKQTHSSYVYPPNGYNYPHPAAKGFYPVNAANNFHSYPLNGQYWMGQPYHYNKFPQNMHWQNGHWNYPGSYQTYPNQFRFPHYNTAYNNYVGQYPMFNANYWMGNNFHPLHMPMFMNQVPFNPMYMHQFPMHHMPMNFRGHHTMYHGQYPYHAAPYPAYPYYGNYYDRGFFGGSGHGLAKGLLGALVLGTVAGTVARRG